MSETACKGRRSSASKRRRNSLAVNVIGAGGGIVAALGGGGNDQESVRKHGRVTSRARRSSAAPGAHPAGQSFASLEGFRRDRRMPLAPHTPNTLSLANSRYVPVPPYWRCTPTVFVPFFTFPISSITPDRIEIGHHPRLPEQRRPLAPSARRGKRRQAACCVAVAAPPGARSAEVRYSEDSATIVHSQGPGNDFLHDFVAPRVDLLHSVVHPHPRDRVFGHVAVSAVQLETLIEH